MSRPTRQRGFTLIEVVLTLAVLAMVLLAVMPSVASWGGNTRIRNTAQSLQLGIETARNEAVKRNENVSFWLINLTDPSSLGDGCTLSGTSPSWIVSVDTPTGHCGAGASITDSPRIVTGRAAGGDTDHLTVSALQSDNSTAATTLTFNGFGRPVAGTTNTISRIDVTGADSGTNFVALRLMVSSAGLVRICDPRITATGDSRKC